MRILKTAIITALLAACATSGNTATFQTSASAGSCDPNVPQRVLNRYTIDEEFLGSTRPADPRIRPTVTTPAPNYTGSLSDGCYANVTAYAAPGALGAVGNAGSTAGNSASATVFSNMSAAGLRLVPQTGYSEAELLALHGSEVTIRPNLSFSGFLGSTLDENAQATALARVSLAGGFNFRTRVSTERRYFSTSPIVPTAIDRVVQGTFADNLARDLTITFDPAYQFSMIMQMTTAAVARGNGDLFTTADFDAFGSLGFSADGPAFDLPEGYTIFSTQLSIYDNQWVDTRTFLTDTPDTPDTPTPSTVPLPASVWLLLAVLGGFFGSGRFRRKGVA